MAGLSRLRTFLRRRVGLFSTRPYGSSSAAQIQYDYYEDEEEEAEELWRLRRRTVADSNGLVAGRGVQWVLMGEKKHVYAEKLSKLLEVPHISMGSLVRRELNPGSSLYQQIANAVNQGKLVQEDIIFGLLSKRLEEGYYRGETGFILEGIPRTRIQAEILDQIADIDLVVNFKSTEELLVKKHLSSGTSREEFLSIRNSGSNLNHQPLDDELKSPSTFAEGEWKEKLHLNAEQNKLLEDYYRRQKKLLDFQVAGAPSETWQGLLAALHLQHMNAVTSSQKLSA